MRILSLDLGTKSLGICISDEMNIIAIPLENFIFEENDYKVAVQRVEELYKEYEIGTILVGHPKRQDGTKSEMTLKAESFQKTLTSILPRATVKLFDERYSTLRGVELLKQKISDPEEIKKNKDMAAAYVMLVDYLSTL